MSKSCVKQAKMKHIKYANKYVIEINRGPVMYAVMDLEQYWSLKQNQCCHFDEIFITGCTEMSKWQHPVQPVMESWSKWHLRFSDEGMACCLLTLRHFVITVGFTSMLTLGISVTISMNKATELNCFHKIKYEINQTYIYRQDHVYIKWEYWSTM